MRKIIGSIWFSTLIKKCVIGIVLINNGRKEKAYIGIADGENKEEDEKYIAKWGGIFPVKQAKEMISG